MKTNEIPAAASPSRSDMLRGVRGFIDRGWTQGAFARDETGEEAVTPRGSDAVCWCLAGAALAAAPIPAFTGEVLIIARDAKHGLAIALGFQHAWDMQEWNDTKGRTQAEVLARIDQALERAGGGE